MRKPNLFIVGAARSGTTSIWNYLKKHPNVFMPHDELYKEPSYFTEYRGGKSLQGYLHLFSEAGEQNKWIGEASVAYLTDPLSSKQIFDFNPKSKIIIILRRPWERAYSLYNWMVQDGYEYLAPFERALKAEEERSRQPKSNWYKPNYYWGYLYYGSGLYYQQIKRFLTLFRDQVLVLNYEELKAEPNKTCSKICSFLEINPFSWTNEKLNPSRAVISAKVVFMLRKLNNFIIYRNNQGQSLKKILPILEKRFKKLEKKLSRAVELNKDEKILGKDILYQVISCLSSLGDEFPFRSITCKKQRDLILALGQKNEPPPPMEPDTMLKLKQDYLSDLKKIYELTGIDLQ